MQLFSCESTTPSAQTKTNSRGKYFFEGLAEGRYQVRFIKPSGQTFTARFQGGNVRLDSNASSTGWAPCTTVKAGKSKLNVDAGLL